MPRGGKREGAGRKPGSATRFNEEQRKAAAASGDLPLPYLLRIMRDPSSPKKRRDWAAATALPFLHARLASIEQTTPPPDASGNQVSALERARRLAFALVEGAREKSKSAKPAASKPPEKKPA